MTVYNETPEWLERSVRSVLSQTLADFELIIIDDGSTSAETQNCLNALAGADSRLHLIQCENSGPGRAANQGLALARAPLVFRHDSDDWSSSQRLERQTAFMAAHPEIVLLGSAVQLYQQNGRPVARCIFPTDDVTIHSVFPYINPFAHGAVCFRREVARAIGGYRKELSHFAEDYDFLWRLSEVGKIANLPNVLYYRTWRAGSAMVRSYRKRECMRLAVKLLAASRERGLEIPFAEAVAKAEMQVEERDPAVTLLADDLMRAGLFRQALEHYLEALIQRPFGWRGYAKLGRLGLYFLLPSLRWRMLKEKYRRMLPPE